MAIKTVNQSVPDTAIERLLSEIASAAYLTEGRLRATPGGSVELFEYEVDILRHTVARMGWLADLALKRIGSSVCWHDGRAEGWLLPPSAVEALAREVQS